MSSNPTVVVPEGLLMNQICLSRIYDRYILDIIRCQRYLNIFIDRLGSAPEQYVIQAGSTCSKFEKFGGILCET